MSLSSAIYFPTFFCAPANALTANLFDPIVMKYS